MPNNEEKPRKTWVMFKKAINVEEEMNFITKDNKKFLASNKKNFLVKNKK